MTHNYTITVKNKSANKTAFLLFTETPAVDHHDNDTIYTNVFQLSNTTNNDGHGTAVFRIEGKTFAICLTSKQALGAGTNITTSDYHEVALGDHHQAADVVQVNYDPETESGSIGSSVKATALNSPPGGFVIKTNGSWSYPTSNHFSIGVGAEDSGSVLPLSIFNAQPNKTYNIFPVTKFYVAPAGEYTVGDVIDIKTIGMYYLVDFTNGVDSVHLEYGSDNAFYPV